jgi:hypothetical protein
MLTLESVMAAADAWNFNCGPGALCAVLGKTPEEIRPHLLDFERKGYTNPTLMADILRGLGVSFRRVYECQHKVDGREPVYPSFGLVRVQWGGPWTKPGVPMAARYRHTHWIGMNHFEGARFAFDVNCVCTGGWLPWREWTGQVVPWLLRECEPKADGTWWPTHCWEVSR